MVLLISLIAFIEVADARRFGGGRSFGSLPNHQARYTSPNKSHLNSPPLASKQGGSAARWLGPLAGIAAGGLLASLFMGHGFQGMQIFDILIVAAIIFLVLRFLSTRKKNPNVNLTTASATRGTPPGYDSFNPTGVLSSADLEGIPSTDRTIIENPIRKEFPTWFNEGVFLESARRHFTSLQTYWDQGNMDKISEFVTPNMLSLLKEERSDIVGEASVTQITNLIVTLDGLDDCTSKTIATVTFSGNSEVNGSDQSEYFNESWNMERDKGENKPWLIAGIRQN